MKFEEGSGAMKLLDNLAKTKKAIGGVIAIILFVLVIFYAGVFYAGRSSEPKITATTILNQLKETNELTTMEYHYTKVGEFENSLQLNGWDIPLTKKRFLLTYNGVIKAGVDMNKAEVKTEDHVITILLPEITITSNVIDESSIEVYDESRNIFNPIKIEDYTVFATQQKQLIEEEAVENGLYSQAATKAQDVITKLLQMIPEIADEYTINIQFQESQE